MILSTKSERVCRTVLCPEQPKTNLPPEYADAHPLALEYVSLSERMVKNIGEIAHHFFDKYGYQRVFEKTYILDNGELLLVIYFHVQDETHYVKIPVGDWTMNCIAEV